MDWGNPRKLDNIKKQSNIQKCINQNHGKDMVLSLYRDLGIIPKDSRDDNHNVTSLDTDSYKYVESGDLVINKMKAWSGSVAVSDYTGIVSPAYYVCKINYDYVYKRFIHHYLRNSKIVNVYEMLSAGMRIGQWDLGIDDFLRIEIAIPPIDEQKTISAHLDRKCTQIDALISNAQQQIKKLKAYKQSVITETVTKGLDPDVAMKDSGVDWIGEIPEHWDTITLSSLSKGMRNGYVGPTKKLFFETGIKYIQSLHIKEGEIDFLKHEYYVSEEWANQHPKIHTGNLLIVQTGNIGQVAVVTDEYDNCNCHALIIVEVNNTVILSEYLSFYLQSKVGKELLLATKTGALLPHLNSGRIGSTMVCVPPIQEQGHIIETLNNKTALINDLINLKQQKIEKLQQYKNP